MTVNNIAFTDTASVLIYRDNVLNDAVCVLINLVTVLDNDASALIRDIAALIYL